MTEARQSSHDLSKANVRHRSLAELEEGFAKLPAPPPDEGRLRLIVCRHAPGVHEAQDRVRLTPEQGVPGDEWNRRPPLKPEAQLTVMRRDVAELVAHGQPLTEPGDNLIVDLDISSPNLPVGTRLRIGSAVVEVSPKPHDGCQKFARRFGDAALRFVNAPATRHLNLRGIYWRVLEAGEVAVDAAILVLSRPDGELAQSFAAGSASANIAAGTNKNPA
jgi:MOSC domain-containing protein YiiM